MKVEQLQTHEYGAYYGSYIKQAGDKDLLEGLKDSYEALELFYLSIPDDKYGYRYSEGKWTIKEILQHLIDTERIFGYRALRVARKDIIDLPGFSQDDYVISSNAKRRTKNDLVNEFLSVRQATISLFESFSDEMLIQVGSASGLSISTRAIGFIIIGHEVHHAKVIRERYL